MCLLLVGWGQFLRGNGCIDNLIWDNTGGVWQPRPGAGFTHGKLSLKAEVVCRDVGGWGRFFLIYLLWFIYIFNLFLFSETNYLSIDSPFGFWSSPQIMQHSYTNINAFSSEMPRTCKCFSWGELFLICTGTKPVLATNRSRLRSIFCSLSELRVSRHVSTRWHHSAQTGEEDRWCHVSTDVFLGLSIELGD